MFKPGDFLRIKSDLNLSIFAENIFLYVNIRDNRGTTDSTGHTYLVIAKDADSSWIYLLSSSGNLGWTWRNETQFTHVYT
jgi:hypothetical protein